MFRKVTIKADDSIGNDREMSPRKALFIVMFFLVGGILTSVCAIRLDWILYRSKSWPKVEGRMVSVERIGHDRGLTYTYQYISNGKTETSTNIEPGPDSQHRQFSEGGQVLVRYSPGPSPYAFLTYPDPIPVIVMNAIGFGWLGLGGIGTFAVVRGPMSRSKRQFRAGRSLQW